MTSSPIFQRIARPGRTPSAVLTALIGGATAALVLSLTLPALMPGFGVLQSVATFLSILIPLITVMLPVVLAGLAANLVHRFRRGDEFDMLRMTAMDPLTLAQGLIWGAAYRLRVLIAVGAGLAVVEFVAVLLSIRAFAPSPPTLIPNIALVIGLVTLRAVAVVVTRVGWMIVGVVLGAIFGLEVEQSTPALVGASVVMVGLLVLSFVASRVGLLAAFEILGLPGVPLSSLLPNSIMPILTSVLPLLALMIFWRVGLRAVRKL